MLVVKIEMWPLGHQSRAQVLSQASISCIGQATRDDPGTGVRRGERAYLVRLFKDTAFGGPGKDADLARLPASKVWRHGEIRGHLPGGRGRKARGAWDLVGGALKVLLGERLDGYVGGIYPDPPEARAGNEETITDDAGLAAISALIAAAFGDRDAWQARIPAEPTDTDLVASRWARQIVAERDALRVLVQVLATPTAYAGDLSTVEEIEKAAAHILAARMDDEGLCHHLTAERDEALAEVERLRKVLAQTAELDRLQDALRLAIKGGTCG